MNKICVYTCITGEYDNLKEIKYKESTIDYYCFTNNKNIKSKTWNVIYIENCGIDNHRLARKQKILGNDITNQYEISVWQDASVQFNTKITSFLDNFFDFSKDLFAVPKHFCRTSVLEEAKECIRLKKDNQKVINKQMEFYKKEKFLDDQGLFETTVFIRNNKKKLVKETMKKWYDMIKNYSLRDQLSLPYVVSKTNLKFKFMNINVWDNNWFKADVHSVYGKTYNVYYSTKNDGVFDDMYVYDYKKKNENYYIKFKPKKAEFYICVAEAKGIICNILSSNCKFTNIDKSIIYSIGQLPHLYIKQNKNNIVEIELTLDKINKNIYNIIDQLNNEINRINIINKELINNIKNIEHSASWKITSPLRNIKKVFRK